MLIEALQDKDKSLLIIGPHPDDVEFSAGRLILRHGSENVKVICMTDGRKGQDEKDAHIPGDEYAEIRIRESKDALRRLGVPEGHVTYLRLPDQEVVSNPYIIDTLFLQIRRLKPDYILIPPWEGAHPDHDATHLFAVIACRNARFPRENIIEYGSYNNYGGKFRIQEFIPMDTKEERIIPTSDENDRWRHSMDAFLSQTNQQREFFPKSISEVFRKLPSYDYSKLPYSSEQAEIMRDLVDYKAVKARLDSKDKLYYETWADINPAVIKEKLKGHIVHYGI